MMCIVISTSPPPGDGKTWLWAKLTTLTFSMHPKQKPKKNCISVLRPPLHLTRGNQNLFMWNWNGEVNKKKQSGRTHGLKGAVAGKLVDRQRRGALLTRRDELIQEGTGVRVMAGAHLLHAGHLHPETSHLLLHGHVHLGDSGGWKGVRN